ncbi:hypothetical protein Bca4012_007520 [Brassica carinata]
MKDLKRLDSKENNHIISKCKINGDGNATRSSDDDSNEIELQRRQRDRTTGTRSRRDGVYSLSRSRQDPNSKPQIVESSARITSCNYSQFRNFSDAAMMMMILYYKIDSWWSLFATLRRMAIS